LVVVQWVLRVLGRREGSLPGFNGLLLGSLLLWDVVAWVALWLVRLRRRRLGCIFMCIPELDVCEYLCGLVSSLPAGY
jgi:hypothetical protein